MVGAQELFLFCSSSLVNHDGSWVPQFLFFTFDDLQYTSVWAVLYFYEASLVPLLKEA